MKKLISIIGPMYNEEALVSTFCEETLRALEPIADRYDFELLLVEDGSRDGTYEQMKAVRARFPDTISVLRLTRNFGLEAAIQEGLRAASGDAVVVMDADLQDPPAVILEMIKAWEQGADIVVGSRSGRPSDSFFKRSTAHIFYTVMDALSGKLKLEESAANFRLLDRKAVTRLLELPEVNGVFRVLVPYLGMNTSVVAYERDKRFAGETKYKLMSMIRYALDSLTGISIEPLRKIGLAGVVSALCVVASIGAIFVAPPAWIAPLVVCAVLSLQFALLFFVLAVIGEYLGQVHIESKRRPIALPYEFQSCGTSERRKSLGQS
ncbi:glycosyltransferase family 2 protein [Xanthomonas sp. 1678]|uniref:glycosyltransferase family 2 protein n=1 Tax=Xanthomonas sp. 1678 TaxID=3158788 RepID=UPI00286529F3|nr:dolichol-phosphate mannosyltransferase [Xanthomonas translucens]